MMNAPYCLITFWGPESDEAFKWLKMNATYAHKKARVSIHSCDISLF